MPSPFWAAVISFFATLIVVAALGYAAYASGRLPELMTDVDTQVVAAFAPVLALVLAVVVEAVRHGWKGDADPVARGRRLDWKRRRTA